MALFNQHGKAVRTFDISPLKLSKIRDLAANLGIEPQSKLMSLDDINLIWEREQHLAKKDRSHRKESDNDPLIHETHDPIHHTHEPEMLVVEPETHEIEPPTSYEIKDAKKLHHIESEAEDGIEDFLGDDL